MKKCKTEIVFDGRALLQRVLTLLMVVLRCEDDDSLSPTRALSDGSGSRLMF